MEPSNSNNHIQYNPVQHECIDSVPSSQSFQNANPIPPSVKPVLNYSIRTGEEFALEFMRDRVNPRMPFVPYPAGDPSHTPGYLELKDILGISHTGSESGSENIVERGSTRFENNHQTSSDYNSLRGLYSSSKIKILCSFGGKILPRPSDGKLRYVGGSTRIIRIRKDIFWQELRQKALEIYIETRAIKYQLPGEDLDALVSVSCDEDLQNMMEECSLLGIGEGPQKLRLFLFSLSDLDDANFSHANSGGDNEFQFVVAVNGMDVGSRQESGMHGLMTSSANNASDLDGQNAERNTPPLTFVEHNVSSNAYGNHNQMHHGEANLDASVPQREEKLKGDSSMRQEFKQTNVRSSIDDVTSMVVLPGEGKLPPKPKMNEDQIHAKAAPKVNRNLVPDSSNASEPSETGSLVKHHDYPAPNPQAAGGGATGSDQTFGSVSRPEQGAILIDINDRFPRDFLSDVFARVISEDSHGIGVLPQDGVGLSMNIANHEPKHWSYFQKLAQNEFQDKDVSLIDQDHRMFISKLQNGQEEASVGYNVSQFPDDIDSRNTFIEDEEKEIHGSESTSMQPPYNPSLMKNSEGMQFDDLAENLRMPDSEYEVETRNDGLPSFDLSLGDVDIGSLQIIRNEDLEELRELGSGTFGTVYHGKWRGTDVAIKRIKKSCFAGRSSEQERLTFEFWREAVILSELHHPNVMAFYGVVHDGPDGTLATVTEFMVDGSLRHVLLRKDRNLDHRKRLIIAMDAAFGMEYLHSKNIVHFDLKCDNLLVNMKDSSRPICKVGDFGLSKIKRNTLVSGGVRGTLPWMAPELLNGGSNKVDVFSFGIVLWEILTREEPYANMHYGAIIGGGIVSNTLRPTIPSDCDPDWRRLMEQCWAPDPVVRPSFTEITNQLRVMSAAYQNKTHAHKPS
ncbi:hypothetical protein E3N88_18053 [Mikania micrantha]|uniref:Protein kinase domain-containing protein n=1 Tax=Mikania micrantha TaxID=192012 RepID=A0A5N6NWP0_9ASTR|nr:hypothetical protein E3N88_18053 [Mikania micrantha]